MTTYYKLTDENDRTRGLTQWGEGITHSGTGKGELCGPGWIHAYTHPLLAVLLNPIHADLTTPHLWECEGGGKIKTDWLKVGMQHCTTIRRIDLPVITMEQRVRFAILCALRVCDDEQFIRWATDWLDGADRSIAAARAEAAWAALAAARAAARAALAAWTEARAAAAEAAEAAQWATAEAEDIDLIAIALEATK